MYIHHLGTCLLNNQIPPCVSPYLCMPSLEVASSHFSCRLPSPLFLSHSVMCHVLKLGRGLLPASRDTHPGPPCHSRRHGQRPNNQTPRPKMRSDNQINPARSSPQRHDPGTEAETTCPWAGRCLRHCEELSPGTEKESSKCS